MLIKTVLLAVIWQSLCIVILERSEESQGGALPAPQMFRFAQQDRG